MSFNKSHFFILLFFILFLPSCRLDNKTNNVQSFNVRCELVYDEEYILGKPNQIALSDSVLVIIDSEEDSLLHFFDIVRNNFINKAGRIGQGPNEFTTISSLNSYGDDFGMYDPNLRKYYKVLCNNDSVIFELLFKVDSIIPLNIHSISNNRYISTGIYKEGKFCLTDSNGKVVSMIEEWPYRDEAERKVSNHIKAQAYMSNIVVNPSKDRILSYSATADILSFYEIKGHDLGLIKEIVESYPEYDYRNNPNSFRGTDRRTPLTYLSAACTDDYVFLLNSGKSTFKYGLNAFNSNSIHVYTWSGNKVAELVCDMELRAICVSSNSDYIYAIAYNPEPTIVKVSIPTI